MQWEGRSEEKQTLTYMIKRQLRDVTVEKSIGYLN